MIHSDNSLGDRIGSASYGAFRYGAASNNNASPNENKAPPNKRSIKHIVVNQLAAVSIFSH